MTHDDTYRAGFAAGYAGHPAFRNPHVSGFLRRLWFAGFTEGQQRRRVDIRDGRHSEINGRIT